MNTCNLCNKTFKFNYLLLKHQNRKNSCVLNNNGDVAIAKKHYDYQVNKIYKLNAKTTDTVCGYCKKTFATKYNLTKHINNTCNIKIKEEEKKNELKNIYDAMYAQQQKFKEDIKNFELENTKLAEKNIELLIQKQNVISFEILKVRKQIKKMQNKFLLKVELALLPGLVVLVILSLLF